jgi:hypothetical protein
MKLKNTLEGMGYIQRKSKVKNNQPLIGRDQGAAILNWAATNHRPVIFQSSNSVEYTL